MKLICYALRPDAPVIRAAPPTRPWMDAVVDNHAYRCLPLTIANSHGWEILAPFSLTATWDGGVRPEALTLRESGGAAPPVNFVASHFGYGIVTFHLWYLFRTEPGWDLFASGPLNQPKDGAAPLTGVIETDWLPYPFTMNWHLTRAGTVEFRGGEPVCMVFPCRTARCRRSSPRSSTSAPPRTSRRRCAGGRSGAPTSPGTSTASPGR